MFNSGFYKNEFQNIWHGIKHHYNNTLNVDDRRVLLSLKNKGWATLDLNLFSKSELEELRKELRTLLNSGSSHVWSDDLNADHRLFGSENTSDLIHQFYGFQRAHQILNSYLKLKDSYVTTMAGHIKSTQGNLGSGGGWHRDTADFKQVKSIIYLSDVEIQNGPFQYIEGSQIRQNYLPISNTLNKPWNERRYTQAEVETLQQALDLKISTIVGKAGTILLIDTSGIHRGMPVEEGERFALTNYMWHQRTVPSHIKKLILRP